MASCLLNALASEEAELIVGVVFCAAFVSVASLLVFISWKWVYRPIEDAVSRAVSGEQGFSGAVALHVAEGRDIVIRGGGMATDSFWRQWWPLGTSTWWPLVVLRISDEALTLSFLSAQHTLARDETKCIVVRTVVGTWIRFAHGQTGMPRLLAFRPTDKTGLGPVVASLRKRGFVVASAG